MICPARIRQALLLAGMVGCLAAVPHTAFAQSCQGWNTSLFTDAYYSFANGTFTIYGEGVDYDAGCCFHTYGLYISATTPSQQQVSDYFDAESGTLISTLEVGTTTYEVEFWVECWCTMAIVGFEQDQGELVVPPPPIPTGEITNSHGWYDGGLHQWVQFLLPTATSFYGRQVTEYISQGGWDTCHFPESIYDPFTTITGGAWPVEASNVWGIDYVGWFEHAITYYRQQMRAPCGQAMYQSMRINVPGAADVEYVVNTLESSFTATTVTSRRAGQTATHTWP